MYKYHLIEIKYAVFSETFFDTGGLHLFRQLNNSSCFEPDQRSI